MSELTYTQNGDYLIPDLSLSEQPQTPLGKYGRMRKNYARPAVIFTVQRLHHFVQTVEIHCLVYFPKQVFLRH